MLLLFRRVSNRKDKIRNRMVDEADSIVGFTERGWKVLLSFVVLLLIGAGLQDIFIVLFSVVLGIIAFNQFLIVRSEIENLIENVEMFPMSVESTLVAGSEFRESIIVKTASRLDLGFVCGIEYSRFEVESNIGGDMSMELVFKPPLSGEYSSDSIWISAVDRLGLVKGKRKYVFHLHFRVYPRVFPVAIEALELLSEMGAAGMGAYASQVRGRGLDYAGSREYVPGDPLNYFDWKAMARLRKPIVKEFFNEGGEMPYILYEPNAPDPVSLDELSATFLQVVTSLADTHTSMSLGIFDGNEVMFYDVDMPSNIALETALKYALNGFENEFVEHYSVLEPEKSRYLLRILKGTKIGKLRRDDIRFLHHLNEKNSLILVSSLSGKLDQILRLTQGIETSVVILQPTKPWIWSKNLESCLKIWSCQKKIHRLMFKIGVNIITILNDLKFPYILSKNNQKITVLTS